MVSVVRRDSTQIELHNKLEMSMWMGKNSTTVNMMREIYNTNRWVNYEKYHIHFRIASRLLFIFIQHSNRKHFIIFGMLVFSFLLEEFYKIASRENQTKTQMHEKNRSFKKQCIFLLKFNLILYFY